MPRPFCRRRVSGRPAIPVFKPIRIPLDQLEQIVMTLDEFEAIRLADLEGHYQEQAADTMRVSRPTFSRIVESAHRKIADALVHGKALRMEGGPVRLCARRCCRLHDGRRAGASGETPRGWGRCGSPAPGRRR
jgi:predicted DNA-binding protein (UPF0251 family)